MYPFLTYFPFKYCFSKPKPNFKNALKKAIRHRMDIKVPKSDREIEEDPFLQLGYGVNQFYSTLIRISQLMLFFTIVYTIPVSSMFAEKSSLVQMKATYSYSQYTLGNLGGSDVTCGQAPQTIDMAAISLNCKSGDLDTNAVLFDDPDRTSSDAGIINSGQEEQNYCRNDAFVDPYNCSQYLNVAAIKAKIDNRDMETFSKSLPMQNFDDDTWRLPSAALVSDEIKTNCF